MQIQYVQQETMGEMGDSVIERSNEGNHGEFGQDLHTINVEKPAINPK